MSALPLDNLPGWRWARIKQLVLVGLSSSRHSEVCNALGGPFGVAHSIISDNGISRPRGCQQKKEALVSQGTLNGVVVAACDVTLGMVALEVLLL